MVTQVRKHWGIQLSPHRKVPGLGTQERALSSFVCVDVTAGHQLQSRALLLSPVGSPIEHLLQPSAAQTLAWI